MALSEVIGQYWLSPDKAYQRAAIRTLDFCNGSQVLQLFQVFIVPHDVFEHQKAWLANGQRLNLIAIDLISAVSADGTF